ncbi:hypothetical protein DsansV1_C20g0165471 [Dioscorea sansibarensis]
MVQLFEEKFSGCGSYIPNLNPNPNYNPTRLAPVPSFSALPGFEGERGFSVAVAMVSEEVASKLVRFLYFVGAGVICTKGINLWRDYERKAATKAAEAPETPVEMVNGAVPKS